MVARLSAFVLWALVAATAVFWGLRLWVTAPAAPAYAVPVGEATAVRGDLSRLLGSAPVATTAAAVSPEASSRFRLLGIMAPKGASADAEAHGVALIAVDGKMAKAYAVGAHLDTDLVLKSVSLRTASIGSAQGAPAITLELPPLAAAATGKLPAGGMSGGAPMAAPVITPQIVPQLVPQTVPPAQALPQPLPPPPADLAPPTRPEAGSPTK
jgi:general secretion pathway protein C